LTASHILHCVTTSGGCIPAMAHTEAKLVLDYVRKLMEKRGRNRVTANDIGIITPYRKQVQRIRVLLKAKGYEAVQVRCMTCCLAGTACQAKQVLVDGLYTCVWLQCHGLISAAL